PHAMIHGPHLREPIDDRGESRQMLADRQSGLACRDRFELAADPSRRCGFHVECVQVRWPAELMEKNDCLRPRRRTGLLLGSEQRRQAKTRDARGPGMKHAPAGESTSGPKIRATGHHIRPLKLNASAETLCY